MMKAYLLLPVILLACLVVLGCDKVADPVPADSGSRTDVPTVLEPTEPGVSDRSVDTYPSTEGDSTEDMGVDSTSSRLPGGQGRPDICLNRELLEVIRTIDDACPKARGCNFLVLEELDDGVKKEHLLNALRNPWLQAVHLFFPANHAKVGDAFDWGTVKRTQLASIKALDRPENAVVYVLGRASITGNIDHNRTLSRDRMRNVMNYMKHDLGVNCSGFRGAWFGKEVLQLDLSDAQMLNVASSDYRSDPLVLNQSVHVFMYPCGDLLG